MQQETLPQVTGEGLGGQQELIDPGPVRALPEPAPKLQHVDPNQMVLPGVEGVHVSAKWRRQSEGGESEHVPWGQLELQLDGIEKHRGREWTENDLETMGNVEAQTFGVIEFGQRSVGIRNWMVGDAIFSPVDGEPIYMPANSNALRMFAMIWAAFEAGAGGVYMSKIQWAERLGCSERSVYNYMRRLEALDLCHFRQCWAPRRTDDGLILTGSRHAFILARMGGRAVHLAPLAFEFKARPPRRKGGFTRQDCKAYGREIRNRSRARAWEREGIAWRRRQAHKRASEERQALSSKSPQAGGGAPLPAEGVGVENSPKRATSGASAFSGGPNASPTSAPKTRTGNSAPFEGRPALFKSAKNAYHPAPSPQGGKGLGHRAGARLGGPQTPREGTRSARCPLGGVFDSDPLRGERSSSAHARASEGSLGEQIPGQTPPRRDELAADLRNAPPLKPKAHGPGQTASSWAPGLDVSDEVPEPEPRQRRTRQPSSVLHGADSAPGSDVYCGGLKIGRPAESSSQFLAELGADLAARGGELGELNAGMLAEIGRQAGEAAKAEAASSKPKRKPARAIPTPTQRAIPTAASPSASTSSFLSTVSRMLASEDSGGSDRNEMLRAELEAQRRVAELGGGTNEPHRGGRDDA